MIPFLVYFIYFIISTIIWRIFNRFDNAKFKFFHNAIGFIGVAVHELSHFVACICVGIKPIGLRIRHYEGYVGVNKEPSFAQTLIISLAPLVVSVWLLTWALDLFLAPTTSFNMGNFLLSFMISLLVGGAPSNGDLILAYRIFESDPKKNFVVLVIILVSFAIAISIVWIFELVYVHDAFILLAVILLYHLIKLTGKAVKGAFNLIKNRSPKKYARYKPNYIYDTSIEEGGEVI